MNRFSQDGQDIFLTQELFKGKTDGIYVDIGANDGVTLSNTKLLEDLGWEGTCIEPIPSSYEKLVKSRKSNNLNIAISKDLGDFEFLQIDGYSEMLSGLLSEYDPRHLERIDREIKTYGGTKKIVKVKCEPFSTAIKYKHIDYLSIDVEGGEMSVLESIDFDKHDIKCISVENNYNTNDVKNFLTSKNYRLIKIVGADNFYLKNEKGQDSL